MALWEALAPRRPQAIGRARRWPGNLGVVVIGTVLVRLVFPVTAVGTALLAESRGFGLLHAIRAPAWAAILAAVIALDLAIYLQHVLFHAVPVLWRFHRMHHADLEFDVTTGCASTRSRCCCPWGSSSPSPPFSERRRRPCPSSRCCSTSLRCSVTATSACRRGSRGCCARSWSPPRCTVSTTRSHQARPTATTVSISPGGIGCSAPIVPSRQPVMST